MLGQPMATPLDFEFMLWRFPVRVYALFWLTATLLCWSSVIAIDSIYENSPGRGVLIAIAALSVFASILIHELGHALAFRRYGLHAAIALYHFGGYAMPVGSTGRGGFGSSRLTPGQDFWIAFAGPLAQVLLALIVAVITVAAGFHVPGFEWVTRHWFNAESLQPVTQATPFACLYFVMWPSVWWALFNLLPVWPLDGGRLTQALDRIFYRTDYHALVLSLVVAVLLAAWGLTTGNVFWAIFFGSMAIANYQSLYGGGWA